MSDIKTLLRYDARKFVRDNNSASNYDNRAITFTSDGYIVTHGIAYDASGIAKSLDTSLITKISNIAGGGAGELVYQTATDKTGFVTAGTSGLILKSNGTGAPSWIDVVTYGLALNSEDLNKGVTSNPTYNLGKIYAPISAGTAGNILISNGSGAPIWKSLWTSAITADVTNNVDNLSIPTVNAVNNAIATAVGSYIKWQGNTLTTGSGTNTRAVIPTTTATAVGYAWRVAASGELPAANSATGQKETLESGDILICITPYDANNSTKTPVFTVALTNWTIDKPSSVPTIGTSATTIATIGGVAILAMVAADANTWRPIQVGGTLQLGDSSGGTALNFIANNTGITVSYDSGIKINLDTASTSEIGGIKIAKDNSNYAVTALTSNISAEKTANAYTKDLGYFGLEIDSNDKAFVYIPTAVANLTDSSRVFGLVSSSSNVTNTTGYTAAPIINGLIYTPNIATLMGSTAIGASNKGIYWTNSGFTECSHTVDADVPAGAVFTDTNTWRPVYGYTLDTSSTLAERLTNASTGTGYLQFGSEFVWTEGDTGGASGIAEIHLAWAEVDDKGVVTYAI